jgi:hypothetical protein
MEFSQASENEKSTQSSEYQSAAVVQDHHNKMISKSDDRGCSRSMRYATVVSKHKKSQHIKDITTHGTGKSDGSAHSTEYTCQENVAWKSGALFRKPGISKESSVLEKRENLLECRGASKESTLDSTSIEHNLHVVSGKRTESEINTHLCHSNSAQEIPEEEEVERNDVRNVPPEEQTVLSKGRKTKVVSYKREKRREIINDHVLENMPHKDIAVQSQSSRHMLQSHGVIEKHSCDRSQDEVVSEKTSYEQNVQDLPDKESLMEVGNFTQKMTNCKKTWNTDKSKDSRCFSQTSCHEGTDVYSCSYDSIFSEEDTAVGETEYNTVKLKRVIHNNNNTGKSSENTGDDSEEIHEECQENSTDLLCMQPLRDANDGREVQGIENSLGVVNIDGKRKSGSDIPLHDIYKIHKENASQLSYQECVKETLNASPHILGRPEMVCLGSNGKGQESNSGHTAENASEQNAMRLSSTNSRAATNTYMETLLTQQDHTVNKSQGPEYPAERIICYTVQNVHVTCTGYSDRELPGSSSLESGKESATSHM